LTQQANGIFTSQVVAFLRHRVASKRVELLVAAAASALAPLRRPQRRFHIVVRQSASPPGMRLNRPKSSLQRQRFNILS
jgi:hypothetical protein